MSESLLAFSPAGWVTGLLVSHSTVNTYSSILDSLFPTRPGSNGSIFTVLPYLQACPNHCPECPLISFDILHEFGSWNPKKQTGQWDICSDNFMAFPYIYPCSIWITGTSSCGLPLPLHVFGLQGKTSSGSQLHFFYHHLNFQVLPELHPNSTLFFRHRLAIFTLGVG